MTMNNQKKTPKPGSAEYNVEKTEELTIPKFHSSTDHRNSQELPATENLNDEHKKAKTKLGYNAPKPDLGNKRADDEDQKEKLITP
jgi:hypothetical protein